MILDAIILALICVVLTYFIQVRLRGEKYTMFWFSLIAGIIVSLVYYFAVPTEFGKVLAFIVFISIMLGLHRGDEDEEKKPVNYREFMIMLSLGVFAPEDNSLDTKLLKKYNLLANSSRGSEKGFAFNPEVDKTLGDYVRHKAQHITSINIHEFKKEDSESVMWNSENKGFLFKGEKGILLVEVKH